MSTASTNNNVTVITHPLVQHKLTLMRRKDASTNSFRRLLGELSTLMAYEVTRDMPLQDIEIETPLETMTGKVIDGKKLVLVSILRAGNGFLDGMLNVVPGARVDRLKKLNPRSIKFVCLLAAPEGIATMQKAHPDVPIFTAAIDRELSDHGYILPGLGDAGDRIFGTK